MGHQSSRKTRLLPMVLALLLQSPSAEARSITNAAFLSGQHHHQPGARPAQSRRICHSYLKTKDFPRGSTNTVNKARGYRLIQHSRKQHSFARIKTNTQRTYNDLEGRALDNGTSSTSSSLQDKDLDPLLNNNNKKNVNDEYRVVSDVEREQKALKSSQKDKQKNKKQLQPPATAVRRKGPVLTTQEEQPFITQQPAWMLSFSQMQESMDEFKHAVQTRINDPLVETVEASLILLSSVLVAITTLPDIPLDILGRMETVEQGLSVLFVVEFLTRWLSSNESKGKFVTQPLVLVDFVVVLLPFLLTAVPMLDSMFPDALSGQSGLFNLRLLRVLRLQRVLTDELTFSRFVYSLQLDDNASGVIVQQWELRLARVVLSLFTLLSVAAGLIYTTEHAVNEGIPDYFSALYFTLTTLTTVGFGDIVPITWQGKLAVSASILAGITIIPSQAAALVEALLEREDEKQKSQMKEANKASPLNTSNSMIMYQSATGVANNRKNSDDTTAAAMLEEAKKCPTCRVGLHWSHATYCYNCAYPLQHDQDTSSLLLPDKS